jgi:hypothetical protein
MGAPPAADCGRRTSRDMMASMRKPGIGVALALALAPTAAWDLPSGPELSRKALELRRTASARARGRMAVTIRPRPACGF